MCKEEIVVDFYVTCNKLKDVIRTGWKIWNVRRERIESVAEHIYGTQMLALAMASEYSYELDLKKVIFMLAIHELGECIIGDYALNQISKEEKMKIEHEAVHKILGNLNLGYRIEELFLEFDDGKTEEARFAYQCDKLECDIQAKIYDEENCVDLNNQPGNDIQQQEKVAQILKQDITWGQMWLKYGQENLGYDENFMSVSKYTMNNKILKKSRE